MTPAASEALFGSFSRGDSDSLSDRDILVVDDDLAVLRRREEQLSRDGWSVAPYTFDKLDALARKGALFIQHLKLESRVLTDKDNRLSEFLESFTPKKSYTYEMSMNNDLAKLSDIRVDTALGHMWAADVLYVAVRNFAILYLAERQRYTFSYSGILSGLLDEGVVGAQSINLLAELRSIKVMYREGRLADKRTVGAALDGVADALPEAFHSVSSKLVSPRFLLANALPLQPDRPPYHRLRHLERAQIALAALCPDAGANERLARLKRWICNPRAYASLASTVEPQLLSEMRRTASPNINGRTRHSKSLAHQILDVLLQIRSHTARADS